MTEASYKPAPLVPVTDPLALRDATVRDYQRNAQRMGITVDLSTIEALAVADLQMVDHFEAGIDRSPVAKSPNPPARRAPEAVAEDPNFTVIGPGFARSKVIKERPDVLYARAHHRGEKWAHAVGRVRRILQGAAQHRDIKVMAATAQHPKCALEYLRLWAEYLYRKRKTAKHNRFKSLSERDAARMFEAELYNICDRSTGSLGHWWVK